MFPPEPDLKEPAEASTEFPAQPRPGGQINPGRQDNDVVAAHGEDADNRYVWPHMPVPSSLFE